MCVEGYPGWERISHATHNDALSHGHAVSCAFSFASHHFSLSLFIHEAMDQLNQFANLLAQLASHENAARSKAEQEYTQFVSNDYKTGPYLEILFSRL